MIAVSHASGYGQEAKAARPRVVPVQGRVGGRSASGWGGFLILGCGSCVGSEVVSGIGDSERNTGVLRFAQDDEICGGSSGGQKQVPMGWKAKSVVTWSLVVRRKCKRRFPSGMTNKGMDGFCEK